MLQNNTLQEKTVFFVEWMMSKIYQEAIEQNRRAIALSNGASYAIVVSGSELLFNSATK